MNELVISVILMLSLCLLRVNVILALLFAALSGGILSGMGVQETLDLFIKGMGGNGSVALSYILLGALAVTIAQTGITQWLVSKLLTLLNGKRSFILLALAAIASASQNIVPVHIAFIPLLIPPLLPLFNRLNLDRRAVASALTFGLKAPYIALPIGFGLIFHQIIAEQMKTNGMEIEIAMIPIAMILPAVGMVVGLLLALFFTYRKPRVYSGSIQTENNEDSIRFTSKHLMALIAIVIALVIQLWTDSMVFGALSGLLVMYIGAVIRWRDIDELFLQGVKMMAFISFVMLAASGYSEVIKTTGAVDDLVSSAVQLIGDQRALAALIMLLVGLFITMGIGTSFGTIPILATLFVPLCAAFGFSPLATAAIIGTAGALGDAGSPASDSTLGPTSGLNVDGLHNHIWDTCVPTFVHYNIPLIVFGWLAAVLL